ncbi:Small-subunit processome, Utp12 [Kalmanozyma brasiliensis GHG001]|uniref:Small-subunit processome Utp12 domain-containing protein n=1 Tax=Kalmanozyma brasiliensis (strain GHG001) TaxID=1365824 RepID=V5GNV5_KALBG|nr:Small-subunit processome, Utp12 [Kalmanozyma brasiliensis GHG001]EST07637.1 Small-subunit processome, Utp12 [Kalmanozyma brasiliensis GHG001]
MAKNKTPKPARSRPASTSELNQPLLPSSGSVTASTASCSFSPAPDHTLFAHISNQVHQQRLRIYNASASAASSSQLVTDFLLASLGGAECLSSQWVRLSSQSSKSAKRRKHDAESSEDVGTSGSSQLLLALGLSSGQVHLLSPALAQSVAILDASSASGSSTASAASAGIVSISYSESKKTLFACSKNGWVSSFALADVKLGDQPSPLRPFSSFRPDTKSAVQLLSARSNLVLSAHHSIGLTDADQSDNSVRATFTGHASPVTHLEWLNDTSFVSAAEGDRMVSAWTFDSKAGKAVAGRAFATAALDGPVRALSVSFATSSQSTRTLITIVTQTGSVRIYGLPAESKSEASPSKKKSAALPSLELLAQSPTESSAPVEWIDARLVSDKLRLARLIRGAKVSIDETTVVSGKDAQLQKTLLLPTAGGKQSSTNGGLLAADTDEAQLTGGAAETQRYTDAPLRPQDIDDAVVAAGLEDGGFVPSTSARGADLEPTLAQRLKELGFSDPTQAGADADEDDADVPTKKQQSLTNEASLASSLSQALHSGDTSLLTSCLNHNDAILIRNTVRKISGPLAVKLLEECVGRLNGVGGTHVSKGSMGSQKARGLMEWIRATLLNHMGYLMSLPNLVSRMSGLHATLTTRLATHERLLALNGRLELVLSQIEARAAYVSQASGNAVRVQGVKFGKKTQGDVPQKNGADKERRKGKKWVEESDDSDSDDMAVDGEDGVLVRGDDDEDGDVQDIALGADGSDDDEDEDDSDEEGPVRRRRRVKNGRMSDGNTSADSDGDDDEDEDDEDIEDIEEDEDEDDEEDEDEEDEEEDDEEELPDESDLEEEGASDMEDDEDEEEYDEEEGRGGPNGMFDLEAEEGTDEDDEE